jgi:hypothetical protein
MLALALILAAVPTPNAHSARVPTLNQVQAAIIARGETMLRVSGESCSPISVSRRERESRNAIAAARCSFRYGAVALADPAARPTRWRRHRADFYLTGSPCGGDSQGSDLTCYSWTTDRELN